MKFSVTCATLEDLRAEFIKFCERRANWNDAEANRGSISGHRDCAIRANEMRETAAFWREVEITPSKETAP